MAARCLPGIEDDRTGAVLGQPPFDLPYQLLAFLLVGLLRLLVDQLIGLRSKTEIAMKNELANARLRPDKRLAVTVSTRNVSGYRDAAVILI